MNTSSGLGGILLSPGGAPDRAKVLGLFLSYKKTWDAAILIAAAAAAEKSSQVNGCGVPKFRSRVNVRSRIPRGASSTTTTAAAVALNNFSEKYHLAWGAFQVRGKIFWTPGEPLMGKKSPGCQKKNRNATTTLVLPLNSQPNCMVMVLQ